MRIRFIIFWLALGGVIVFILFASASVQAESTIVVPRDYPTIQAAVDAAAPGDTISVKAGMYAEEVVISKDLNLTGAGTNATVIKSPATLTQFAADLGGNPFYAIVRVAHGAHVHISGLTVSGPVPCGFVIGVVVVQAATLDLSDARVSDLLPNTTTCSVANDWGVQFGLGRRALIDGARGTTAFGRVSHVMVDGFLNQGLVAVGPFGVPPTSVTFADNVITAALPPLPTEQFGIEVFFNAVAQVTGNTVTGVICTIPGCGPDPINDFQSMGINVAAIGIGTWVSDNHVSGADIGVYQVLSTNCCKISQNTLTDNRYFGIVIQDGDGTASENTITGGQIGIGVVADSANTVGTLRGNKINNTSVTPVKEIQCCGFTATAIVK